MSQTTLGDRPSIFRLKSLVSLAIGCILVLVLTACEPPPRLLAQDRLFLDLAVEFLGEYQLPKITFQDTRVGGLSTIAYDRQRDRFYALSDDRSNFAPARFYTLNLHLTSADTASVKIDRLEIEDVTFLKDEEGNNYPPNSIDPEGIALSPRGTVFIASEGIPSKGIDPLIGEFDLRTGQKQLDLPIPQQYLRDLDDPTKGIQENLGFEALTVSRSGLAADDPFRLFTATESALLQDRLEDATAEARIRLLHYVINPVSSPVAIAEHLYLLEPAAPEIISNGLTELMALDREGYFLSLERTFGFTGAGAKIFEVVNGNATDTSRIDSFAGSLGKVRPLNKKLILDLSELGIYLDNLEGMSLGPRLPDGSQSLLLVSDDNFNEEQITQFLLFRLVER
ncbi:esterase-like activity of phytase family protein [Pleurocapsales cyanobacterium LEGE 06147]|nr:esterase-like activity of phytase family protein [Pleurocapsales cyanobacterium LEGE 06147]